SRDRSAATRGRAAGVARDLQRGCRASTRRAPGAVRADPGAPRGAQATLGAQMSRRPPPTSGSGRLERCGRADQSSEAAANGLRGLARQIRRSTVALTIEPARRHLARSGQTVWTLHLGCGRWTLAGPHTAVRCPLRDRLFDGSEVPSVEATGPKAPPRWTTRRRTLRRVTSTKGTLVLT